MPLDIEIIRASEFVRLGPTEHLDFEASKHALRMMAAACRKRGIDRALLDLRTVVVPRRPMFSRTQLIALVETFHEAGFERQQRLAVLYREDPHHGVRKFAFIGTLQGWQVRAFAEFEKALLWLSAEDLSDMGQNEEIVPVRVVSRKVPVKSKPETNPTPVASH